MLLLNTYSQHMQLLKTTLYVISWSRAVFPSMLSKPSPSTKAAPATTGFQVTWGRWGSPISNTCWRRLTSQGRPYCFPSPAVPCDQKLREIKTAAAGRDFLCFKISCDHIYFFSSPHLPFLGVPLSVLLLTHRKRPINNKGSGAVLLAPSVSKTRACPAGPRAMPWIWVSSVTTAVTAHLLMSPTASQGNSSTSQCCQRTCVVRG